MHLKNKFIILVIILSANMPFMNQYFLFFFKRNKKSAWCHLLELIFLYLLINYLIQLVEITYPQKFSFYLATFILFIISAFPGFTFYYLLKPYLITKK